MLLSLSIVIQFFYQTLGVLSQDGLLRFIDIHACKQLFEIGGADEVLYPNDKVSICSPFFFFFIIILFFFSWLGLLFLYICSPNAGSLPFLFLWVWTSVFYSFYPSLTVSFVIFSWDDWWQYYPGDIGNNGFENYFLGKQGAYTCSLYVRENGEYKIINENNVKISVLNQPKCTSLLF